MSSLYGVPVTGMQGADYQLNVVANNIANLNTSGYEAAEPVLASLPAQAEVGDPNNGIIIPAATHVGMGTRPAASVRSQQQALLQPTGNPLDLAVNGPGFITLRQPDGRLVYARQVSLHLEPDGHVITSQGLALVPPVKVPAGVLQITADSTGRLIGLTTAGPAVDMTKPIGALSVVTFAAPENLREQSGLYTESLGSGRPQAQPAVQSGVVSGYQLRSTVDLATEMTNMVEAERMFQVNSKALQTLDSLVNTVVSWQPR